MSVLHPQDDHAHNHIIEQLSAYIDGQLSPAKRAEVDSHLASCPACMRELETLQWTVALVRAVPPRRVPRSFAIPVPAETPVRPRRFSLRWSYGFLRTATACAALLLIVVVSGDLLLRTTSLRVAAPALAPAAAPAAEKRGERAAEAPQAQVAAAPQSSAATPAGAARSPSTADRALPETEGAVAVQAATAQPTPAPARPAAPMRAVPGAPPPEGLGYGGGGEQPAVAPVVPTVPAASASPSVSITRTDEAYAAQSAPPQAETGGATSPAPPTSSLAPPIPVTPVQGPALPTASPPAPSPDQPSNLLALVRLVEAGLLILTLFLGLATIIVSRRLPGEPRR